MDCTEFVSLLKDKCETPNGWQTRCPAHGDNKASLSVTRGDNGGIVLHCHAGCSASAIVQAMGLKLSDLMPNSNGKPAKKRIVAKYDYHDELGELLFQKVRYEPKKFSQRRPDGRGGWVWKLGDVRRVLYNLPEIVNNPKRMVAVAEGEKDADNLAKIDVLATTNFDGAGDGKWEKTDAGPLAGRDVFILPDNDDIGRQHAQQVAQSLYGVAKSVRIVPLPGLREKGDVSDWLAAGGTKDQLKELIHATPEWTPDQAKPAEEPSDEPPPYQEFPTDILPTTVRDYVGAAAAALGCDASYVALPLLAALAACVGNTRRIRLKRSWAESCVFWMLAVGPSGSMKSPGWEHGVGLLQKRQDQAFKVWKAELEDWEREAALYDAEMSDWKRSGRKNGQPPPERPKEPQLRRYLCSDATVEAVADRLADSPRGMLLSRDELSGWLSGFDAYKGVRGADVAHWLSMHRAGAVTVDRKTGRRVIHVPRGAVSITGTIQPEILRITLGGRYENGDDDESSTKEHLVNGLAARLLFAYPPVKPKRWTEADIPHRVIQRLDELFSQLLGLDFQEPKEFDDSASFEPIDLPLTSAAKSEFIQFYNANNEEQTTLSRDLAAAWSKLEGYAARFALLMQLLEHPDSEAVDLPAMEAGITLSRWFGYEASRIYAVIGADSESEDSRKGREQSRLLTWVHKRGGTVTPREVAGSGPREFRGSVEDAEHLLRDLAEAGHGEFGVPPHSGSGRPAGFRFVASSRQPVEAETKPSSTREIETFDSVSTVSSNKETRSASSDTEGVVI